VPIFDLLNSASFLSQLELVNTNLGLVNTKLSDIYDRLHHVEVDSYVDVRVMDITGELPLPASEVTGLTVFAYAAGPPAPTHVIVDSGNIDALVSGTADNPIYVTSTPFSPFVIAIITNSVFVRTDGSFPFNVVVTNTPLPVEGNVNANVTNNPLNVSVVNSPSVRISDPVTVRPQLKSLQDSGWADQLGLGTSTVLYSLAGEQSEFTVSGCLSASAMAALNNSSDTPSINYPALLSSFAGGTPYSFAVNNKPQ